MAFGKRKSESPETASDVDGPLASYDVAYRGGLANLPKAKAGKIVMSLFSDRLSLEPTLGSKGFWQPLCIPYAKISSFEIADRNVSTFEAIAGGLNSRQLNQKNNIHITYATHEGHVRLRLEMLSGVTVMGQAKKCAELEDRMNTLHIREQFAVAGSDSVQQGQGVTEELKALVALKSNGLLTEEEFTAAKAKLLG